MGHSADYEARFDAALEKKVAAMSPDEQREIIASVDLTKIAIVAAKMMTYEEQYIIVNGIRGPSTPATLAASRALIERLHK